MRSMIGMVTCAGILAGCESGGAVSAAARAAAGWTPEWAPAADAAVRPGVRLTPSGCTAAFLFVDPETRAYFLSTADHCTSGVDGHPDGLGTRVGVEGFGEIGTVVIDGQSEITDDPDFALIAFDPGINLAANPQVFGLDGPLVTASGPTGFVACADVAAGSAFAWHGHSQFFDEIGEPARAREGYTTYCLDHSIYGGAPAYRGDSGSASLLKDDGRALGILVALSTGGGLRITPMDEAFGAMGRAGYGGLALATIDGRYVRP